MTSIKSGTVITFYSYKGGTGRTMALANVGCLLAQRSECNVLMIDWDLEAPGLHRYFHNRIKKRFPDADSRNFKYDQHPGLIELFEKLKDQLQTSEISDDEEPEHPKIDDFFRQTNIREYIIETDVPKLHIMKAGKFDVTYSERTNSFKWENLFVTSPWLFSALAIHLSKEFHYVLIDARTGITDTSGICTMLMPEKLVLVFTPNRQSLTGILDLVRRATEYRRQSEDWRPLTVFPLASRIEMAEDELRKDWRFGDSREGIEGYQLQFEQLFKDAYALKNCDLSGYFDSVQIQHVPRYAYGEEIAVLTEQRADRLSLSQAYESFTDRLLNLDGPWGRITSPVAKDRETQQIDRQLLELSDSLVSPLNLTLFLACPSDIVDERAIVRDVCEQVVSDPQFRGKINIEIVSWDSLDSMSPMLANLTPQEAINRRLPRPSECDIVVVVFWARMGTPLSKEYQKPDGSFYRSTTEWAYFDAIQTSLEYSGVPQILVFRRIEDVFFTPTDPQFKEKIAQWNQVDEFFGSFVRADRSAIRAYNTFENSSEFRVTFSSNLRNSLIRLLEISSQKSKRVKSGDKIFISYRRADTAGYAGRLYDRLQAHFGNDKVFMDIDAIQPGVDFTSVIDEAISSSAIMLVLIGRQWLTATDDSGRRRLDNPNDFVRLEVRAALRQGIPTIPVLLDDAYMPNETELPDDIKELAWRHAIQLTHSNFHADSKKLIDGICSIIDK